MAEIQLTKGLTTVIDDCCKNRLSNHNWHAMYSHNNIPYAATNIKLENGKQYSLKMHRFILGLEKGDGKFVDHIDGNSLNNKHENLRIVTPAQNAMNRKTNKNNKVGYKGVHYYKTTKKYVALIRCNRKRYHLGYYDTAYEAHLAYSQKAKELFGEYKR